MVHMCQAAWKCAKLYGSVSCMTTDSYDVSEAIAEVWIFSGHLQSTVTNMNAASELLESFGLTHDLCMFRCVFGLESG